MRILATTYNGRTTWTCVIDGMALTSDAELSEAQWQALAEAAQVNRMEDTPMSIETVVQAKEDSPIEAAFKAERDELKVQAITYICQHPQCDVVDLLAHLGQGALIAPAGLLMSYIVGAAQSGMIADSSFEAFRDFIATKTLEELMAI